MRRAVLPVLPGRQERENDAGVGNGEPGPAILRQDRGMDAPTLFSPADVGPMRLDHRVVMAPMTRIRADAATLAPDDLTAHYYAQRASEGGLLISEAVHVSPEGTPTWKIYSRVNEVGGHVPGIWTQAQVAAWRNVTDAVHGRGGRIFCQLLHAGRVAQPEMGAHPLARGWDAPPVSASAAAIQAAAEAGNHYNWDKDARPPRALETREIPRLTGDYVRAAQNAMEAGFDGVELHGAHGYLIEQFLNDGVNRREDAYGGSVANRCRLLFGIVAALIQTVGEGRVSVRLSPTHPEPETGLSKQVYFGVSDSDPAALYTHAVAGLNDYPLAYLMLTEPRVGGLSEAAERETAFAHPLANIPYRAVYHGTLIGAGGFTPATARAAVAEGHYDLIAFGRWFISNPDLPARIRAGTPLTVYERRTFYGSGAEGYTDYPRTGEAPGRYRQMPQERIGASLASARGERP